MGFMCYFLYNPSHNEFLSFVWSPYHIFFPSPFMESSIPNVLLFLTLLFLLLSPSLTTESSSCSPEEGVSQKGVSQKGVSQKGVSQKEVSQKEERRGMERGIGGGRGRNPSKKTLEQEIEKRASKLELLVFSAVSKGKKKDGRERFLESAEAWGVRVVEIFYDESGDPSSLALPQLFHYLSHPFPPSTLPLFRDRKKIILFLYGEETILLDNPTNLIKKFLKMGGDVVFGGEGEGVLAG